jgi:hypothetical protein
MPNSKHLTHGITNLMSLITKTKLGLSDSLLMVQQVAGEFHCLEGSLRAFLDACLDVIGSFAKF